MTGLVLSPLSGLPTVVEMEPAKKLGAQASLVATMLEDLKPVTTAQFATKKLKTAAPSLHGTTVLTPLTIVLILNSAVHQLKRMTGVKELMSNCAHGLSTVKLPANTVKFLEMSVVRMLLAKMMKIVTCHVQDNVLTSQAATPNSLTLDLIFGLRNVNTFMNVQISKNMIIMLRDVSTSETGATRLPMRNSTFTTTVYLLAMTGRLEILTMKDNLTSKWSSMKLLINANAQKVTSGCGLMTILKTLDSKDASLIHLV